jgi:hypothetical protein
MRHYRASTNFSESSSCKDKCLNAERAASALAQPHAFSIHDMVNVRFVPQRELEVGDNF